IPYDTVEKVFKAIGPKLGKWMPFLPDGEVGDRIHWIAHLAYRVFHGHPDVETLERPMTEEGIED
ncbi:uncharacterized protein METZ01_LOCUS305171, partial [marine metagenome]